MDDGTLMPATRTADTDPAARVAIAFLAGYPNPGTRAAYRLDLTIYFRWCQAMGMHPLRDVKRGDIQAFASHLATGRGNSAATICRRLGTLSGFYETAVLDEFIEHSPCHHIKHPKVHVDPARRTWLTRWELGAVLRAAQESRGTADWALVTLLGTIGMRVTAACSVRIEDLTQDASGYRMIYTVGKGGKPSQKVLPIPTWRAIDRAIGDRGDGPLLARRDGSPMTRKSADLIIKRLCRTARVNKKITPHSLRRSFATIALEAGVPVEVVQADMDHESTRTTQRYDRLGVQPHARASNTVAALLASAS